MQVISLLCLFLVTDLYKKSDENFQVDKCHNDDCLCIQGVSKECISEATARLSKSNPAVVNRCLKTSNSMKKRLMSQGKIFYIKLGLYKILNIVILYFFSEKRIFKFPIHRGIEIGIKFVN